MSRNVAAVLKDIAAGALPPLEEVCQNLPRKLSDIVNRAMSVEPENRYESARELRAALEETIRELPQGVLESVLPKPEGSETDPDSLGLGEFISSKRIKFSSKGSLSSIEVRRTKERSRFFLALGAGAFLLAIAGFLVSVISASSAPSVDGEPGRRSVKAAEKLVEEAGGSARVAHGDVDASDGNESGDVTPEREGSGDVARNIAPDGGEAPAQHIQLSADVLVLTVPAKVSKGTTRSGARTKRDGGTVETPPSGPSKGRPGELIRDLGF